MISSRRLKYYYGRSPGRLPGDYQSSIGESLFSYRILIIHYGETVGGLRGVPGDPLEGTTCFLLTFYFLLWGSHWKIAGGLLVFYRRIIVFLQKIEMLLWETTESPLEIPREVLRRIIVFLQKIEYSLWGDCGEIARGLPGIPQGICCFPLEDCNVTMGRLWGVCGESPGVPQGNRCFPLEDCNVTMGRPPRDPWRFPGRPLGKSMFSSRRLNIHYGRVPGVYQGSFLL